MRRPARLSWTDFTRATVFVVLAALPSAALAGWSAEFRVQSFIPTEQGLVLVAPSDVNALGCTSNTWMRMDSSDASFALVTATILTAHAQGKPVKVWMSNCHADGLIHFTAAWLDQ